LPLNGEGYFSGNSGGWVTTYFSWHYLPVKSAFEIGDTIVIRFNFESDSINSGKEGWMIDNIRLYSGDLGGGIKDIKNGKFKIYPNPMNETTTIELNENYSKIEVEILNSSGQLIEQRTFSNKRIININKNNLQPGIYLLKIKSGSSLIGTNKLIIK